MPGWVTCDCGEESYIRHIKHPVTDKGDTLECPNCNREIFRWGKGTDDYILVTKEQMRRSQEEEAKKPTCRCNMKMVLRSGIHGFFYGCAHFPNGCNETQPHRD